MKKLIAMFFITGLLSACVTGNQIQVSRLNLSQSIGANEKEVVELVSTERGTPNEVVQRNGYICYSWEHSNYRGPLTALFLNGKLYSYKGGACYGGNYPELADPTTAKSKDSTSDGGYVIIPPTLPPQNLPAVRLNRF